MGAGMHTYACLYVYTANDQQTVTKTFVFTLSSLGSITWQILYTILASAIVGYKKKNAFLPILCVLVAGHSLLNEHVHNHNI